MKLSDYVIDFLAEQNVKHIFEICGGAITHLLDSLYDRKDIETISMHHEQAAAFAAEGYARSSKSFGVAMATSGPGATNMITGIGSCFFDSIPCLFITGQVNTYEFKFDRSIRQLGFQETDIVSMVKPIVKEAILIKDPKDIRYILEKLIFISKSGRPGPVLLDIPMNIQRADINPKELKSFFKKTSIKTSPATKPFPVKKVCKYLKESSRPLIIAGGGARLSGASNEIKILAKTLRIPVVSTLLGRDVFPNNYPLFSGMIGTYGNRYANLAVANADLILALGARFDTRQTGTKPSTFARQAKIVHVDIDPCELNDKVKADVAIEGDIKYFLKEIISKNIQRNSNQGKDWKEAIKFWKKKYPSFEIDQKEEINPNFLMEMISQFMPKNAIACVDVGQNQMWAAQSLKTREGQRFLTQGGMGAMGSALSLAIGACFANPKKCAVVITGDGGFQLNTQELQTVSAYNLPIKIILLNNYSYGMVKQFQSQYFNKRFQSTVKGYNVPNFQKVVASYKIKTEKVSSVKDLKKKVNKMFSDSSPQFLEVKINANQKVFPKLSVNRPVEDQDPSLSREELKNNMIIEMLPETEYEF